MVKLIFFSLGSTLFDSRTSATPSFRKQAFEYIEFSIHNDDNFQTGRKFHWTTLTLTRNYSLNTALVERCAQKQIHSKIPNDSKWEA